MIILPLIFSFLIAICIALSVVPNVPALLIMFVLSLFYAYIDNFVHVTVGNLAVLFVIAIVSFAVDILAGVIGAKYGGASGKALVWGWIGLILGTLLIHIPFVGSLIGLFLGIFICEMVILKKDKRASLKSAVGGIVGTVAGAFGSLFLACLYFALFVFFIVK